MLQPGETEWWLKRNCSMSPRQLALVFGSLGAVSFGIGFAFAQAGIWLILPFAGIECLALLVAYVVWGRHAGDFDRVRLEGHEVVVQSHRAGVDTERRLPLAWLRLNEPDGLGGVELQAGPVRLEVGRMAPLERREQFAREFRQALRQWRPAL